MKTRLLLDGIAQANVSGDGNHRNATLRKRGLDRNLQNTGHLLRLRYQFAVVAALRKKMLGMGFLKISAPDLITGNLRRQGEHRNPAAMAVIESVDQMQIPRSATAGAYRKLAGEMSLCARGKRGRLFVPHVNPPNLFLFSN